MKWKWHLVLPTANTAQQLQEAGTMALTNVGHESGE